MDTPIPVSSRPYQTSEKAALERIYRECGGEAWMKSGRWLKNPEPSTWHGVVIESGFVTKLMLPSNNLTGTLPDIFASLPRLKVLYLNGNLLQGRVPVSIGTLSKLECLDLSQNQFSGPIPRTLGGCPALRRLLLDHNGLSGETPSTLGCLSNLRWVDMRENGFEEALPGFLDFIPVRRPSEPVKF